MSYVECKGVVDALPSPLNVMVLVNGCLSLRVGEVLALHRDDIDWDNETVMIQRNSTHEELSEVTCLSHRLLHSRNYVFDVSSGTANQKGVFHRCMYLNPLSVVQKQALRSISLLFACIGKLETVFASSAQYEHRPFKHRLDIPAEG